MSTDQNNQAVAADTSNGGGEGESNNAETITINRSDYDKLQSDLGSLKRENKDLKKPKEPKNEETPNQTNDSALSKEIEELAMQVAGITKDSELELARKLQKETNLPMKQLINSKYFKSELEDLRASEANAEASSGIKGDKSNSQNPKSSAAYWIAKGEYPPRDQVSDKAVRKEIRDALVAKEKGSTGRFYNS